ncbi:glucokinase [Salsuginibacillus halophilus]|uniref:Glucokinase n=1 Tax=Salsuginibacillus halophilus TaxID=517424 RepID=A0A2P8H7Y2_9BACI|nr:ROK family glucokinase [Salsuginibacillus halophilus]PSL42326.1 glucokinase [Salsuginibacillus halophilus]
MTTDKTYLAGIDIGGTSIKLGLFTTEKENVAVWQIPTSTADGGRAIARDVAGAIEEKLNTLGIEKDSLAGAGAGAPGYVRPDDGVVTKAVNIGWEEYPLAQALTEALERPVFVQNDANLAAAGEAWRGAAAGIDDVICITIGTGVGAGLLVNGEIIAGRRGTAGEIGHLTVEPDGRRCNCGRYGCLEQYASATAVKEIAAEALTHYPDSTLHQAEALTAAVIYQEAAAGDVLAQQVVDQAAAYLGLALGNLATALNPERILIGGGVSAAGDTLMVPLAEQFERFALDEAAGAVQFSIAKLGNEAGISGAAWLAAKRLGFL